MGVHLPGTEETDVLPLTTRPDRNDLCLGKAHCRYSLLISGSNGLDTMKYTAKRLPLAVGFVELL